MTDSQNQRDRIEELIKPRVILENKYPGCPYEVGEILYEHEYGNGNKYFALKTGALPLDKKSIKDFPYIFRSLKWWEERTPEEMPEYIKFYMPLPERERICKVDKFEDTRTGMCIATIGHQRYYLGMEDKPATETEYNEYISTK